MTNFVISVVWSMRSASIGDGADQSHFIHRSSRTNDHFDKTYVTETGRVLHADDNNYVRIRRMWKTIMWFQNEH